MVLGVVSATALACNFYYLIATKITPWWRFDPAALKLIVFLIILLSTVFLVHLGLRKLSAIIKWERLHWSIQGLGLILGAVRGLWWAGLTLLVFLSLGVPGFTMSIEERSILGPHLVKVSKQSFVWVADRYPGHVHRPIALIPSVKLPLPKLPKELQLGESEFEK